MSGLYARLTVTPLLWACGLLLAAVAALGAGVLVLGSRVEAAESATAAANARTDAVRTERDAWKGVAGTASAANAQWQSAFGTVHALLQEAQGEARRLDQAGRAALAAAHAREAEANRTLDAWMQRYADQVLVGSCAAALNAVQGACPRFEGY